MHRINSPAQVANSGRVTIDAGAGITISVPLSAASSTEVADLVTRLAFLEPKDLGTAHLDTATARGRFYQPFAARATKAQGYPWEGVAGILTVDVWNPSNGNMIATFKSWDRGAAKRTLYMGTWRPWLDFNGNPIP